MVTTVTLQRKPGPTSCIARQKSSSACPACVTCSEFANGTENHKMGNQGINYYSNSPPQYKLLRPIELSHVGCTHDPELDKATVAASANCLRDNGPGPARCMEFGN